MWTVYVVGMHHVCDTIVSSVEETVTVAIRGVILPEKLITWMLHTGGRESSGTRP